ncbi:hypothetical protein CFAM422_000970 [Trichoderma lentiforme]|uniref:Uncharacterized protein n=1 Tax=Trichoderma lentiforme TaxID=1567552 RepID=A0A9P5CG85_9HYPO|nr:hypothetical protein CFAM422_000970 [Trichoderma lentiforme]
MTGKQGGKRPARQRKGHIHPNRNIAEDNGGGVASMSAMVARASKRAPIAPMFNGSIVSTFHER